MNINRLKIKNLKITDDHMIKYYINKRKKECLILINAFGIPMEIWKYVISYFSDKFTIITWKIECNKEKKYDDFQLNMINSFALELDCIIKKEKIERAHFISWCSGLKILLEYYKINSNIFNTISIITGYFEPLTSINAANITPFDYRLTELSDMLIENGNLLNNIQKNLKKIFNYNYQKSKDNHKIQDSAISTPLLGKPVSDVKQIITKPFLNARTLLDYCHFIKKIKEMPISNILKNIDVPTLIINAGNDIVSHPKSALEASKLITNVKYIHIEEFSHWCLWDNNKRINSIVNKHINNIIKTLKT